LDLFIISFEAAAHVANVFATKFRAIDDKWSRIIFRIKFCSEHGKNTNLRQFGKCCGIPQELKSMHLLQVHAIFLPLTCGWLANTIATIFVNKLPVQSAIITAQPNGISFINDH